MLVTVWVDVQPTISYFHTSAMLLCERAQAPIRLVYYHTEIPACSLCQGLTLCCMGGHGVLTFL